MTLSIYIYIRLPSAADRSSAVPIISNKTTTIARMQGDSMGIRARKNEKQQVSHCGNANMHGKLPARPRKSLNIEINKQKVYIRPAAVA